MVWSAKFSSKKIQKIYKNNLQFRVFCTIFHNLQLESTQKIKAIDLDYYVINHQWFRVVYIILRNLQSTDSHILLTKRLSANPITDY